jgi:broad-specificity NMP kinase
MKDKELQLEEEIRILREYVVTLKKENSELQERLNEIGEQLKKIYEFNNSLNDELMFRKQQDVISAKYSDSSRNY